MSQARALGGWKLLAWLAIFPLVLYLTLTGAGAPNGVFLTPFRVATEAILLIVFGAWLVVGVLRPAARPRTAIGAALVTPLIAMAITTGTSEQPRLGLEFVGWTLVLGSLYLMLVRVMSVTALARRMTIVVGGVTLALALAYVGAVLTAWIDWWSIVGRLAPPPLRPGYEALTYGAPGTLSAFLALGAGASVPSLWRIGRKQRVAAFVVLTVALVAIVLAGARSSWVAVAVGIVIVSGIALYRGFTLRVPNTVRTRAVIGAATLAVAAGAIVIGPAVLRRIVSGGGEELRTSLAATAVRTFANHPLTGSGPGTWVGLRASETVAGEVDYYLPHAHNVPLQLLAEMGLLGLAAIAIIGIGVVRLVLRGARSGEPSRRALVLSATFAAAYLATHQLFDAFLDAPAVLFVGVLPVAMLDAAELREGEPGRQVPHIATVLIPAAALVAVVLILARLELPALQAEKAVAAASEGHWSAAESRLAPVLTADGQLPPYVYLHGLIAAGRGDHARAALDFESVARSDDLPQAWLNLAALRLRLNDPIGATSALDSAMRLGVQQPAITVPAATLWLQLEQPERAQEAIVAALRVAPSLADDPYWATETRIRSLHEAAAAEVVTGPDPRAAMIVALFLGDIPAARSAAVSLGPELRHPAELAISAWAGDHGSRQQLEAQAQASPLSTWTVAWAARVAAHEGDRVAARRFYRWAALVSGVPGSDLGADVRIVDAPAPDRQTPGPNANFHFRYAYRRSMPWDLLVAGLPKLTLALD